MKSLRSCLLVLSSLALAAFAQEEGDPSNGVHSPVIKRLIDTRDGQTYKTVQIGNQVWMAQNLNYAASRSWCYDDKASNCSRYGRLYEWTTTKQVCPSGWHVPSVAEWSMLMRYVDSATSGTKLKSTNGWSNDGNGTDAYDFTALPAGDRSSDGRFGGIRYITYFWSAEGDGDYASGGYFYFSNASMHRFTNVKSNGFSVRCLEN